MPKRLPEKTKTINRRPRRLKRARHHSEVYQQIPEGEGQKMDVVIGDIDRRDDIAEKTTV